MKTLIGALVAGFMAAGAANAAEIDFSGAGFSSTFVFPGPFTDTQAIDGITFDFSVVSQGADGYRQSFDNSGLSFGIPGNGMFQMDIVADVDIVINSVEGKDTSVEPIGNQVINGPLFFDFSINGSEILSDSFFTRTGFSDLSIGATLLAGETFTIFGDVANSGYDITRISAVLGSLDYDVVVSDIPLPAGMPLLLAGLGAFGIAKRRKR